MAEFTLHKVFKVCTQQSQQNIAMVGAAGLAHQGLVRAF
tara:strand:- start:24 stop:140 length:117 start_codon:yes stop_codon:yes gene_type:complete